MGVWIEIIQDFQKDIRLLVAPFVGVWIEIKFSDVDFVIVRASLPSWECGLKFSLLCEKDIREEVAPFVGVWIEMYFSQYHFLQLQSLPSWECGLKS